MPGVRCTVALCTNSKQKNNNKVKVCHETTRIIFHTFPKDPEVRKIWVHRCRRDGKWNPDTSRICSIHFSNTDYERDMVSELLNLPPKRILKPTAVPTLLLSPADVTPISLPTPITARSRSLRQERRLNRQEATRLLRESRTCDQPEVIANEPELQVIILSENNNILRENVSLLQLNNHLEQEILYLKSKLKKEIEGSKEKKCQINALKRQVIRLKSEKAKDSIIHKRVSDALDGVFTESQKKMLISKNKKVKWDDKSMAVAFALRYLSYRSYVFLRRNLKYPLPAISTLRRWASSLQLRQGVLDDVFTIMEIAGKKKQPHERLVVIEFDEMKTRSTHEYDVHADEIVGPHSQLQVVIARGLFDKWKQPLFADFDVNVTKELLFLLTTKLHNIGYDVIACVSDMGATNRSLWNSLGISEEKTWCKHPDTDDKIYFFADTPHLLKLIRNWLIDTGFTLGDGSIIHKGPLVELVNMNNTGEYKSCHKLTSAHVTCEKSQRQNVRMACQLLSHSTATALSRYKPGPNPVLCDNLAGFISEVNDWFDVLNSYTPEVFGFPCKSGYGLHELQQNAALDKFANTVRTMKPSNKKTRQVFQKGILITTESLKSILQDVKLKYGMTYILTHRLNQDALENTFSQLRTNGGLNDHPTPLNALYRLRMIILGKNASPVQNRLNTEDKDPDEYLIATVLRKVGVTSSNIAPTIDGETIGLLNDEFDDPQPFPTVLESLHINAETKPLSETEEDGLVYIAGWIAKKYKKTNPHLGDYTYRVPVLNTSGLCLPSWVVHLSYGGLTEPSEEWKKTVVQMESHFTSFHGATLLKGKGVVKNFAIRLATVFPDIDINVLRTFSKIRTIIRMRYLNQMIVDAAIKKSKKRKCDKASLPDSTRKYHNKIKKIIT